MNIFITKDMLTTRMCLWQKTVSEACRVGYAQRQAGLKGSGCGYYLRSYFTNEIHLCCEPSVAQVRFACGISPTSFAISQSILDFNHIKISSHQCSQYHLDRITWEPKSTKLMHKMITLATNRIVNLSIGGFTYIPQNT